MSGILFLGNDDFQLRQGDQGHLLALSTEQKGLHLVLFYSKECPYCDNLINKFKQLPNFVNGCTFGMVNVNRNMSIVERSKITVAPITYVPDVILYVNGIPYVRYDGPHDIQKIKEFIFNIYQKIQKTAFIQDNQQQQPSVNAPYKMQDHGTPNQPGMPYPPQDGNPREMGPPQPASQEIPAYTLGKPLCGNSKRDGVCYLNFNSAYVNAN